MCADARVQRPEPSGPAPGFLDSIKPLEIGESMPEYLWHLPLQVVNHAEGTEAITLNDYKGKLIILDFWATWCKSCIANMPRMHELQTEYHQDMVVLPVTYEDAKTVSAFLGRTADSGMVALRQSFRSVIADDVLKLLFPNPDRSIPYFAIIGVDGMFKGLTIPPLMNRKLISQLVQGEDGYIPPLQPAPETPLLERSPRYAANRLNKPFYYSMLSGYMEGFTFPSGRSIDSVNRVRRDYYINLPLLMLYSNALESGAPTKPNRRVLLIDSAGKLESDFRRNPAYRYREYSYCYEATSPIDATDADVKARMLSDLNTLSGFKGQIKRQVMPCLILRYGDPAKQQSFNPTTEGKFFSLRSFIWKLNEQYDKAIPLVVDETGFKGKLFLDEATDLGSVESISKLLQAQGFELHSEQRAVDVFILSTDEVADIDDIPLQLTKYGYVRKEGNGE
jgi:Thiol-disulfide isomerase and thioredoxins